MIHYVCKPKKDEFPAYEILQALIRLHRPKFELSLELCWIVYDQAKDEAFVHHPTSMLGREDERWRHINLRSVYTKKRMYRFMVSDLWSGMGNTRNEEIILRGSPKHDLEITESLSDSIDEECLDIYSRLYEFQHGVKIAFPHEGK